MDDSFRTALRDAFLERVRRGPTLMGILNVTPDSFFDGGRYDTYRSALVRAETIEREGCDIIDIGGESTRPGADPVDLAEELNRVIPVVETVCERSRLPVSIDTYKAAVAREAVRRGAVVVNDVGGLHRDPAMADSVAESGAVIIVMHNRARADPAADTVAEVCAFFERALERAAKAGIPDAHIMLDPGIGFGKTHHQSIACLKAMARFKSYGHPVLIGLSRKSMIGKILGDDTADRLAGTLALNQLAIAEGAAIIRVHDVAEHRQMLTMLRALGVIPGD